MTLVLLAVDFSDASEVIVRWRHSDLLGSHADDRVIVTARGGAAHLRGRRIDRLVVTSGARLLLEALDSDAAQALAVLYASLLTARGVADPEPLYLG